MAWMALMGSLVAGVFGMVHDQITYTISPEYFTRMKFDQFRAADFGFPSRVLVAEIGFLAAWWVGLIATWFLARIALRKFESPDVRVMKAVAAMVGITIAFSVSGFFIGPWLFAKRPGWNDALDSMGVTDFTAFQQVAGIHLGSYAGALLGWIAMLVKFTRDRRSPTRTSGGRELGEL